MEPDHVALTPDGNAVWVGRHGAVASYEVATRRLLARFAVEMPVEGVALRPDGRVLAAAGHAERGTRVSVRTIALASGATLSEWRADVGSSAGARLAFSPDGRSLAVASRVAHRFALDAEGALLDPRAPSVLGDAPLAFDPSGRFVACARGDRAQLLDVSSGETRNIALGREVRASVLAFSPDGARLAVRTTRKSPFLSREPDRVVVVETAEGRELASWTPPASSWGLRFAGGARVELAFGRRGAAGELGVFDALTGAPLGRRERAELAPPEPFEALPAEALAFHGGLLVTRNGDQVRAWDVERGAEAELPARALRRPEHDPERGLLARAAPGGRTWRSMGDEHDVNDVVELAELETGRTLATLGTHEGGVRVLLFTSEGLLVSGGRELAVWDPPARARVATLGEPEFCASSALAEDGGWIASAGQRGRQGEVRVFEVRSGACVARVPHDGMVTAVALHRRADRLALGTDDGRITLSRASDGATLAVARRHWKAIRALAFDEAGARLASAGYDDVVVVREAMS